MTKTWYLKSLAILTMITGLVTFSHQASASTVILNFDGLNASTNSHGTSITESGYTLTSNNISSTKPTDFNSNGTTSIYTQNTSPLTIVQGVGSIVFDILSIDFGEFSSSGTPQIGYSAIKADNSVVSGQFIVSGAPSFWNYHVTFNNLFTNIVSFTLSHNSPFLYQIDNIELSSVNGLIETPLPGAFPLYATGLMGFGLIAWRRRKRA
ncbi:MAG: hypothetical protein JKY84_06015 [Emcibacteraceae bacterium]|nr:hypothetical protein [Emcibacteraceae bacterium]